ncbi:MAG: type II toxin-antitoxin system VapC family toxin [Actinomycetota bacterium]
MSILVDTSALLAVLDRESAPHDRAVQALSRLAGENLMTHNYVLTESAALVHRRLGLTAIRALFEELVPILSILFVDREIHERAVHGFLGTLRRRSSLTDWVSFVVMRQLEIRRAFAFDRDFATQGFETIP